MMKNKWFIGAIALLSMVTLSLTSCDKDDDKVTMANVQFSETEIGSNNSLQATVGKDLHVEAKIVSDVKIRSIEVKLTPAKGVGGSGLSAMYKGSNYVGVLNTTFHEHLEIPSTLPAGTYKFSLIVTTENGTQKSFDKEIRLLAVDPEAPVITLIDPVMTGVAGSKIMLKATIKMTHPVKEIEVEFHGKDEYPIEIDGYKGQNGTINFEKEIVVPANAPAGKYHVHFTVKDEKGLSTTAEIEGFSITAGK